MCTYIVTYFIAVLFKKKNGRVSLSGEVKTPKCVEYNIKKFVRINCRIVRSLVLHEFFS